jgi:hypothetical protein
MDNTTEITSVLLTHITSGKGFKRNKLNYDGQEIYNTIIKLFAVSVVLCLCELYYPTVSILTIAPFD